VNEIVVEIDQLPGFDVDRLAAAGRLVDDAVDAAAKVGGQGHDRSAVANRRTVCLVHVTILADHLVGGLYQPLIETTNLAPESPPR